MKALGIAAACLLLATLSSGKCVEVTSAKLELPTFRASSRRARITTLQDGKALGNVRVLFYLQTDEGNPRLTQTTGKQGGILARALAPGHYRILTIGPEHQSTEVYLEASDQSDKQTNSFLVTIPSTFFPEKKADLEAAPVSRRIREFKGRVGDPSGAFVPGALVQVFRKSSATEPVVQIKTDNEGAYAALLVPEYMLHSFRVRDSSSASLASKSVQAAKPKIWGSSCALDVAEHSESCERI